MKKKRKKKLLIVSVSLLAGLALLYVFAHIFLNPYLGTVKNYVDTNPLEKTYTKAEALEDIKFVVNKIKSRHYSSIHQLPKEVKKQYEEEINNLSDNPTTLEIWQAGSRILNKLQDGHSGLYIMGMKQPYTEASFLVKDGKIYIDIEGKPYTATKINGVSVQDIYDAATTLFSYENDYYFNVVLAKRLRYGNYLSALGAAAKEDLTIEYMSGSNIQTISYNYIIDDSVTSTEENDNFVDYSIDKENKTAVLTLKSCIYNEKYIDILKEFFTAVKTNSITDIAVDLRENGGGNSMVANEFMRYLDTKTYKEFGSSIRFGIIHIKNGNKTVTNKQYEDLLFNGRVYVLTSQFTFSSATMFSVYMQDNKLGKVIGEPSGNRPSAYGDVISFQLPNSKLAFNTTYKYFHRPDSSKDNEDYQIPDYFISSEKALEKFYELAGGNS